MKNLFFGVGAVLILAGLWLGRPEAQKIAASDDRTMHATALRKSAISPAAPFGAKNRQPGPDIQVPFLTPEQRDKLLKNFKSDHGLLVQELYSEFWPQVDVSREIQDTVVDILLEREMDLFGKTIAPENGMLATLPDPNALAKIQAQTRDKLVNTFGEENTKALEDFQRTIRHRRMVQQLHKLTGKELTPQVQEQLLSIAVEESSKIKLPPMELRKDEVSGILLDQSVRKNDAIIARASALLKPAEVEMLRQILAADLQRIARVRR